MSSQPIWSISSTEFVLQLKIKVDSDEYNSKSNKESFSAPFVVHTFGEEIKWQLKVYPKGETEACQDYISIFLLNASSFDVDATVEFYLLNIKNERVAKKKMSKDTFNNVAICWGLELVKQSFITDPKNNLLNEGTVTIGCHLFIHNVVSKVQKSFNRLQEFDSFENLFLNEKYSDLTIVSSDNKNFHVHKAILATRSSVFEAMFEHSMIERNTNRVEVKDLKSDVLLEVLRFLYCGKVYKIETMLFDILHSADKYNIDGLKTLCEEIMIQKLDKKNAIKYLVEADKFNCYIVKEILSYVVDFSKDFVETSEFESLCVSNPSLMFKITKNVIMKKKP